MKEDKLYFGSDKDYFWEVLRNIRETGKSISGRWSGDYLVTTYQMPNGELIEDWENMEYGIPHSLEKVQEVK